MKGVLNSLLDQGIPMMDAVFSPAAQTHVRSLDLLLKATALCNDAVLDLAAGRPGRERHLSGGLRAARAREFVRVTRTER